MIVRSTVGTQRESTKQPLRRTRRQKAHCSRHTKVCSRARTPSTPQSRPVGPTHTSQAALSARVPISDHVLYGKSALHCVVIDTAKSIYSRHSCSIGMFQHSLYVLYSDTRFRNATIGILGNYRSQLLQFNYQYRLQFYTLQISAWCFSNNNK